MGILNVTPDSFSGDGLLAPGARSPVERARAFIEAGADILDVGGESTRPGAEPISAEEELRRVIPVIQAIRAALPDARISIDTYRAAVAAAALDAGAGMVNDVWALRADPEMAGLVAERGVPIVLMHNRLTPSNAEVRERLGGRYVGVPYENLLEDVRAELLESVAAARAAGVAEERIILDPGLGFGKTTAQSLELLNRLDELAGLGYPLLIGPSRKSFIGYTLDLPPDQSVEGSLAAAVMGVVRGANIVRGHDVPEIVRAVRMADAILRTGA